MNANILVIDDDLFFQKGILRLLESEGYSCSGVTSGEDALAKLGEKPTDLVILDLTLPGMDGITTCRRIRKAHRMPILMLTGRSDSTDKVLGLETGADDYLTKPFEAIELIARVRAQLRRTQEYRQEAERKGKVFELGDLQVNYDRRTAVIRGVKMDLTAREYELLAYLAENCDRAISREQLFERVWGYDLDFSTNSLDVHIYRIRKKLEQKISQPEYLHTVRGYGFKLSLTQ